MIIQLRDRSCSHGASCTAEEAAAFSEEPSANFPGATVVLTTLETLGAPAAIRPRPRADIDEPFACDRGLRGRAHRSKNQKQCGGWRRTA